MKKDTFIARATARFEALAASLAALIWAPLVVAAEPYTGIEVTGAPASDHTGTIVLVLALAAVAGIVFLKIKKPDTFAKLLGGAKKLESQAQALVPHTAVKANDGTTAMVPTLNVVAPVPSAADVALQAELAQLRAAATARAQADATAAIQAAQAKAPPPVAAAPAPAPFLAPPVVVPTPPASEMVAVIPTGVNALGSVRAYPKQLTTDYNLLTYASRISGIANPATGNPFFPPGAVGSVIQFPVNGRSFPECVDAMLFPGDWWTSAEIASKANAAAAHSDAAVYEGPIALASLTLWNATTSGWTDEVRDSDFLWWATVQGSVGDAWQAIVGGVSGDIGRAINDGEYHYNWLTGKGVDINAAYGFGKCRAAYDAAKAGTLKPKYH